MVLLAALACTRNGDTKPNGDVDASAQAGAGGAPGGAAVGGNAQGAGGSLAGAGGVAEGGAGGVMAGLGGRGGSPARPDAGGAPDGGPGAGMPPATSAPLVFGVTVDDVARIDAIVDALRSFTVRPTVRVVFDLENQPSYYARPVARISEVADVVGEILDSFEVARISVVAYRARAEAYLDALGDTVDVWEIGNEVNGEWLGRSEDVVAKIQAAYDAAKARNRRTAITLYYNKGCFERADHEMFRWVREQLPSSLRNGVDWALVSYYEDDCEGLQPNWQVELPKVAELFPNARFGIGECGTNVEGRKVAYVERYYRLRVDHPRYLGGFFWWYFAEDMVPKTRPLWGVLERVVAGSFPRR